jgi:hypothetical protein
MSDLVYDQAASGSFFHFHCLDEKEWHGTSFRNSSTWFNSTVKLPLVRKSVRKRAFALLPKSIELTLRSSSTPKGWLLK